MSYIIILYNFDFCSHHQLNAANDDIMNRGHMIRAAASMQVDLSQTS